MRAIRTDDLRLRPVPSFHGDKGSRGRIIRPSISPIKKKTKRDRTKTWFGNRFPNFRPKTVGRRTSLAERTRADASRGTRGVVKRPRFRRHVLAVDRDRRVRRKAERRLKADPEPRGRIGSPRFRCRVAGGKNDGRSRHLDPEVRCSPDSPADRVPRHRLCRLYPSRAVARSRRRPPDAPRRFGRSAILTWFPAHRRSAFRRSPLLVPCSR